MRADQPPAREPVVLAMHCNELIGGTLHMNVHALRQKTGRLRQLIDRLNELPS